ncbi:MAG: RecX family transcriptional regulator [candidate division WOR-3 bacterium]
MRISEIRPQRRNPKRVSVYVDGRYVLGLDQETALELGLRPGLELSPEQFEDARHKIQRRKAMESALRLLSFRARSQKELQGRLRRNFGDELAQQTTERLSELGLLDDRRYAEAVTRERLEVTRYGRQRIRAELRSRGVAPEVIEQALAPIPVEEESAQALLAKVRPRYRHLEPRKRYLKLRSLLLRRGYAFEIVSRLLAAEGGGALVSADHLS